MLLGNENNLQALRVVAAYVLKSPSGSKASCHIIVVFFTLSEKNLTHSLLERGQCIEPDILQRGCYSTVVLLVCCLEAL